MNGPIEIEGLLFKTSKPITPTEVKLIPLDDEKENYKIDYSMFSCIKQPPYSWAPNMTLPGCGSTKKIKKNVVENRPCNDGINILSVEPIAVRETSLCGTIKKVYRSENKEVHIKHYSCERLECPICYPYVAQHNGISYYNEQLKPRMQAIHESNRESGKFYHQVWSIDPQVVGLKTDGSVDHEAIDQLKENTPYYLKKVAYKLMQWYNKPEIKYLASFVIEHPWRLKKTCNVCGQTISHDNNVCGWHFRGTKKEFFCGSKQFSDFYYNQGYHLHMISNFYVDKLKLDEFNDECAKYHVIHHNISTSKRPLFYWSKTDIVKIVSYQLTHAKYIPHKNSKAEFWGYFNHKYTEILNRQVGKTLVVDSKGAPFIEHNFTQSGRFFKIEGNMLENSYLDVKERLKHYLFEKSVEYDVKFQPYHAPLIKKTFTPTEIELLKKVRQPVGTKNFYGWITPIVKKTVDKDGNVHIEKSQFDEPQTFKGSDGSRLWGCDYEQKMIEAFDFV